MSPDVLGDHITRHHQIFAYKRCSLFLFCLSDFFCPPRSWTIATSCQTKSQSYKWKLSYSPWWWDTFIQIILLSYDIILIFSIEVGTKLSLFRTKSSFIGLALKQQPTLHYVFGAEIYFLTKLQKKRRKWNREIFFLASHHVLSSKLSFFFF